MRLCLRGAFYLAGPQGQEIAIGRKRSKGLLALLAFSENGVRNRVWLQDKLWSTREREQGAGSLRQELSYLRKLQKSVGVEFLDIRPDSVKLDFDRVAVDIRSPDSLPTGQDLLEGLDIRDPEFEDWLREERMREDDFYDAILERNDTPDAPRQQVPSQPRLFVADLEPVGGTDALLGFAKGLKAELQVSLGSVTEIFRVTDTPPQSSDGLAYELSGSVRSTRTLRVIVNLLRLPERATIWSARYNHDTNDEFHAQEDISRKVVEAVQAHLIDGEMVGIWSRYHTSLEAWEIYQSARRIEALHTRSGHLRARELYRRVLDMDPDFVPAKIVSVFIRVDEIRLGWAEDPDKLFAELRRSHQVLAEEHNDEPYVHILGAYLMCLAGEHETASREMEKIMVGVPVSPELKSYHALIYEANDDWHSAIAMYREALSVTPYPPNWIRTNLALACLLADDSDAEPMLDLSLAYDERSVRAHVGKVAALIRSGEPEKAQAWARSLKTLQPDFAASTWRHERFFKNPEPIRRVANELCQAGL